MNVPPAILDLRIAHSGRRPWHLWIPLFLLWPLVLAIAILALVLTVLADVVLLLIGQRYHHYTILLARSFAALTELRGMAISFNDKETAVEMTVQ